MIRYQLTCENGHGFEGWFRGSADFDAQLSDNALVCPFCGSQDIAKQLMTPSVSTARAKAVRPEVAKASADSDGSTATENTDAGTPDAAASRTDQDVPASGQVALADPQVSELVNTMRKIRQHVVENSENVGKRFAEEVRAMHYGETKKRGIYGEATAEDTSSLLDDGIEVYPLPVLPEDRN